MAAKNIMIVGVGGQGTLLTSRILGGLAIAGGYDVKLSEVHGMAQRGGSVVTFVRYGDKVAEPIVEEGQADVIIALGSDLPVVAETACELYKAGYGEKLMFCGGIGHSTVNLKKKVAKILDVKADQLPESEAEIYACLAKDKYQIESSFIFMDKTSTNTSENIKNAIQIFKDHTIKHQNVILIQDPILQKRSYVTALDLFNHSQKIINYAPIIPRLNPDGTLQNDTPYLWEGKRLYELALGEVYRLRDDENGYGPNGKGFLRHVDVPEEVNRSFEIIADRMPEYLARCQ